MFGPRIYRLAWKRRVERRAKRVAIALVAIMVLGSVMPHAISTQPHTLVTGHATFFNGDEHDPCLAAIVGIMRLRVLWFNDQVLVERFNGDGAYLYVAEEGAPDPRDQQISPLVSSGVFYDFTDPNGYEWHVREAYFETNRSATGVIEQNDVDVGTNLDGMSVRWYVWIVAISTPKEDMHSGDSWHSVYNFVTLVNTCKFQDRDAAFAGEVTHEQQNNTADSGHEQGFKTHTHRTYNVSMWVGEAPQILPVGVETPTWVAGRVLGGADSGQHPPGGTNPGPN